MKILFIIDPVETLHLETDTTFAIMTEANRRGHAVWISTVSELGLVGTQPTATVTRLKTYGRTWRKAGKKLVPLEQFPIILMRKDPPFTIDYVMATSILSLINPKKSFVMNHPAALRNFNEKLGIFQFPQFIPETIVTKRYGDIKTFLAKQRKVVLKPLEGFAGREVFILDYRDKNQNALLEMLTHGQSRFLMVQRYLSKVSNGDKRILILNGKILGQQNRMAPHDDHRSNISAGGHSRKTRLTPRERSICEVVGKALLAQGIYFAGIDVIGGFITEINVTSPTGLVKINEHEGTKLERKVVDFLENFQRTQS